MPNIEGWVARKSQPLVVMQRKGHYGRGEFERVLDDGQR